MRSEHKEGEAHAPIKDETFKIYVGKGAHVRENKGSVSYVRDVGEVWRSVDVQVKEDVVWEKMEMEGTHVHLKEPFQST
jgi:hypothetical protein